MMISKINLFLLIAASAYLFSCKKHNTAPPAPVLKVTSLIPATAAMDSTVIIHGIGFSKTPTDNIVSFSGKKSVVTAATDTTLSVIVPQGAPDGKITVRSGSLADSSASDFIYIYTVSTLAGNPNQGYVNAKGTAAAFSNPAGLTAYRDGTLFVTDGNNRAIRMVSPDGTVTTFAGGPGSSAFFSPSGVAIDPSGIIYVADVSKNVIDKLGNATSVLIGNGTFGYKDGAPNVAEFNFPREITADVMGNEYIADGMNNVIRKIAPDGTVSTLAGNGKAGFINGPPDQAQFRNPSGVSVDAAGNVYVADEENHRIRRISPAGETRTLAGSGDPGFRDAVGTAAQFQLPTRCAADSAGTVYVVDYGNRRIRKISPAGAVRTIAGDGTPDYHDGIGPLARFSSPAGIAVDANGVVYVTDNQQVRKIQ